MKKEDLAILLNGREYRDEITSDEEKLAKENNLVVVFGASDDLTEFRGAEWEECELGEFAFNKKGLIENTCDAGEDCPNFQYDKKNIVETDYNENGFSISSNIPHAKFLIKEDEGTYREGIVFSLDELNP